MNYTIAQAVSAAQRRFPDLQTSRGVDLANIVHQEILGQIPELKRNVVATITPVSGQLEYQLATEAFQVEFCVYVNDSMEVFIPATTVEALNRSRATWRVDAGVAAYGATGDSGPQFYVSTGPLGSASANSMVIGFYPKPLFTAGTITCYGSLLQSAALISSDVCLISLISPQVYVEGITFYAALDLQPEQAAVFKGAYDNQMMLNKDFVRTRNGDIREATKDQTNNRSGGYPKR